MTTTGARSWRIQCRQSGSRTFRTVEWRFSACEAMAVWSRLVSRAKSGESGRRGEARLVDPSGNEIDRVNVTELVRQSGKAANGVDGADGANE